MKVSPMLFSAPMIRALLDGRKTQTRRVIKPQPEGEPRPLSEWSAGLAAACHDTNPDRAKLAAHSERLRGRVFPFARTAGRLLYSPQCPYGESGDLLWVRETWAVRRHEPCLPHEREWQDLHSPTIRYLADFAERQIQGDRSAGRVYHGPVEKKRVSIHMPRWASRLTLRITDVRVQRLQDIIGYDAIAEGYPLDSSPPIDWYERLWKEINGDASWDENPWVWALTFEVIMANVDEVLRAKAAA